MNVQQRNNVVVRGEGPPLLFAHGFGCDQNMWRLVAPRFEATHTVVRFDYVGCGKSDKSAYDAKRYATLDGYAEDVLEICDALGLREGVPFVAHSVSSMVGAIASIAAPRLFDRIVMIGPSPRFIDDPPDYVGGFQRADVEGLVALMDQNFMGWATALSQMVMTTPELAAELRESFCSTDPLCLHDFARVTFLSDHRTVLPRVETPCLVVQLTRDDVAPVCVGEYLARTLPHARYHLLDAPGHMPQMSHPDAIERLVRDYLAEPRDQLLAPASR